MSFHSFFVHGRDSWNRPFNHIKLPADHANSPGKDANESTELLMLAVERGLSVLGESVRQVILDNIDKKYSLRREDIIKEPDRFMEALQAMFGFGASVIEKLIIQNVCATAGLDLSTLKSPSLSHAIKEAGEILRIKKKANI